MKKIYGLISHLRSVFGLQEKRYITKKAAAEILAFSVMQDSKFDTYDVVKYFVKNDIVIATSQIYREFSKFRNSDIEIFDVESLSRGNCLHRFYEFRIDDKKAVCDAFCQLRAYALYLDSKSDDFNPRVEQALDFLRIYLEE